MLLDLNKQIINPLEEICEPLFEHFPVSMFTYMEHHSDSDFFFLTSNTIWAQDFLSIPHVPDYLHPNIAKAFSQENSFTYLGALSYEGDPLFAKLDTLGYKNYFNFYKKVNGKVKVFSFQGDYNTEFFNILSKEKDNLEKFVFYFEDKLDALITERKRQKANAKLIKPLDLKHKNDTENHKKEFLDKIHVNKLIVRFKGDEILFSMREWDCLKLMSQGLSSKEIASQMCISPRTVESFIVNIRRKTGAFAKSEMLNLLKSNSFS